VYIITLGAKKEDGLIERNQQKKEIRKVAKN
jgi:hypothetical protein